MEIGNRACKGRDDGMHMQQCSAVRMMDHEVQHVTSVHFLSTCVPLFCQNMCVCMLQYGKRRPAAPTFLPFTVLPLALLGQVTKRLDEYWRGSMWGKRLSDCCGQGELASVLGVFNLLRRAGGARVAMAVRPRVAQTWFGSSESEDLPRLTVDAVSLVEIVPLGLEPE